jgi:hypothetical protein
MAKTDILAIASPGSRRLKNAKHEKYCRLRAAAQPRITAYREAGWETSNDEGAYSNACRLERRAGVRERIEYLSHQAEERIVEKRRKLEEQLWGMHEASIKDFFEQYAEPITDKSGNPVTDEKGAPLTHLRERPRLLTDLPPDLAALVEDVTIDRKGRSVPKLYSKLHYLAFVPLASIWLWLRVNESTARSSEQPRLETSPGQVHSIHLRRI